MRTVNGLQKWAHPTLSSPPKLFIDGYGRHQSGVASPSPQQAAHLRLFGLVQVILATVRELRVYNRWNDTDKPAHLQASLTGDTGQVLWDTDAASTDTIEKLMTLLRNRHSGARQSDKYRMEVRLRRCRQGESLSSLHQDPRRLIALANQTLRPDESIACSHYIDAMEDADFGRKVRTGSDFTRRCTTNLAAIRDVNEGYNAIQPGVHRCPLTAWYEP